MAEAYPRKIIPSEITVSSTGKLKNIFKYEDEQEFYDQLIEFLQMVFFKLVQMQPPIHIYIYAQY